MEKPKNIDEYISGFEPEVQQLLQQVRNTIQAAAPEATEAISYGLPTFKLQGNLVHFAAFNNHIGFYALPSGNEAFQKELSQYKTGKGSIQFPFDNPLPLELITKIVKFRVEKNIQKAELKKKK
ncbi:MAG: hypothetical protein DI539_13705 [Flavobacterium psychrophilum]|nr:MAG: hypothetical protein DI539_13705 [Flavobacterium psychrophilum]